MAKLGFPQDNQIAPGVSLPDNWVRHHADVHRKINKAASVASVTTPDATNLATALTLANALKVAVNAIITALNA